MLKLSLGDDHLLYGGQVNDSYYVNGQGEEVKILEVHLQRFRGQERIESRCPSQQPRHGPRAA